MEEKEITSLEDVEELLTPAEPTRTTEGTNLDNLTRIMMEQFGTMNEKMDKNKEELKKQMDEKFDRNEEKIDEKLDKNK